LSHLVSGPHFGERHEIGNRLTERVGDEAVHQLALGERPQKPSEQAVSNDRFFMPAAALRPPARGVW